MKKRSINLVGVSAVAFAILSSLALAAGTGKTSTVRGNFVPEPHYETRGQALTFYVATGGDDTFDCLSPASPCATPQAALNKAPKRLNDQITVNIGAGNFPGFYISGFNIDQGHQQNGAGVLINGTMANATLATGANSGTVTSITNEAGYNWATLTLAGAGWTVDDLQGRLLAILTGPGAGGYYVISNNTATTLAIVGGYGLLGPPDNTSTFAIQDPATVITTPTQPPAGPTGPGYNGFFPNGAALWSFGNTANVPILAQFLRFTNTVGGGVVAQGGALLLQNFEINGPPDASITCLAETIAVANGSAIGLPDFSAPIFHFVSTSGFATQGVAGCQGYSLIGIFTSYGLIPFQFGGDGQMAALEIVDAGTPALLHDEGNYSLADANISCAPAAGSIGLLESNVAPPITSLPSQSGFGFPGSVTAIAVRITGCDTGIAGAGAGSNVFLTGAAAPRDYSGSGITGLLLDVGSVAFIATGNYGFTASGQDISLDDGAVTSSAASIATSGCVTAMGTVSRACKQ